MADQERTDMLNGKHKRLKREIRKLIGEIERKVNWIEHGVGERAGSLSDKVIDQFSSDYQQHGDDLAVKLYELVAVRAELEAR